MTEIKQLSRVVGIAGLATMVLLFVPIVAGSGQEPAFDGSTAEIVTFLQSVSSPLADFGRSVSMVGLLAFLWFVVGLSILMRAAEGPLAWRSSIAAASGVAVVVLILGGSWDAASLRVDDIDPDIARYAFDLGNASFANGWVALGSFAVCSGLSILSSGLFRRWLAWWAIASGIGLALSRAVWTGEVWFLPYALFWVWVIVVSVLLLRGRVLDQNTLQLVGRNA
jgi:hypothetical protein